MELPITMSYSRKSCINTCRRKAFFKYEHKLEGRKGSNALRYGRVFHSCLSGYYKVIKEKGWSAKDEAIFAGSEQAKKVWDAMSSISEYYEGDYRTYSLCMQAFLNYLTFYETDSTFLDIVNTEMKKSMPLVPETEREKRLFGHLPPFEFEYVIDLTVNLGGLAWVVDFKTTSSYIDSLVSKLQRSDQLIGYAFVAKRTSDIPVEGTLASIIHTSARKSTKEGGGYGTPKIDFRRVPQIFTEGDFYDWRESTFTAVATILECLEKDLWPCNYDHCYDYNFCEYYELCAQHRPFDELETGNYRMKVKDDLEVLL